MSMTMPTIREPRYYQSVSLEKLAPAMLLIQRDIMPALKDSSNPFFKSKYADLASVWDAVREALQAHGCSIVQTMCVLDNNQSGLRTMLLHESGEFIAGEMPLLLPKEDPQGQGSAITYARRYALAAMLGVVQEDDDAEAAIKRGK